MIIPTPQLLDENVTYHSEQATESPLLKKRAQVKKRKMKKWQVLLPQETKNRTKLEQKGHCQKLIASKG